MQEAPPSLAGPLEISFRGCAYAKRPRYAPPVAVVVVVVFVRRAREFMAQGDTPADGRLSNMDVRRDFPDARTIVPSPLRGGTGRGLRGVSKKRRRRW